MDLKPSRENIYSEQINNCSKYFQKQLESETFKLVSILYNSLAKNIKYYIIIYSVANNYCYYKNNKF